MYSRSLSKLELTLSTSMLASMEMLPTPSKLTTSNMFEAPENSDVDIEDDLECLNVNLERKNQPSEPATAESGAPEEDSTIEGDVAAEVLELFGVVLVSEIHRFLMAHLPDTIDSGDGHYMPGSQVIVETSKILRNPQSSLHLGLQVLHIEPWRAYRNPKS